MDWPGCDLAQEADLTAQVVMEVSQAPVVTVVYPAMEEDKTLFQNESLKPFQLKQSLSIHHPRFISTLNGNMEPEALTEVSVTNINIS